MPSLGIPAWHHVASLVATLGLVAFALWRDSDRRRHAANGTALWTTLALVTGFLILYLKPELKATGYKDWAKWWHVTWSWLALWYTGAHTWVNRHGLLRAWRNLRRGARRFAYDGLLVVIIVLIPITWSAWGAATIRDGNYIPLTLWTWLAFLVPAYAAWIYIRARRPEWGRRGPTQYFVDAWLIPATLLANLSGIPILFFGTKDTSLKYVAKYWHTAPSIAMAILVFAHTVQFWPGVIRHYRTAK